MYRKLICIVLMVLMALPISALGVLADSGGQESPTTMTASRQGVDLFYAQINNFNGWYGVGYLEDNIYIYVQVQYTGDYYNDPDPAPWDWQYLYNANVTFDGVFDSFGNPVATSPITWVNNDVDNNNGDGIDMCDWCSYWLYDNNGNYMAFRVNNENIKPGNYQLRVKMEADVIVGYNPIPDTRTFEKHSDYEYFDFTIVSSFYFNSVSGITQNGWNTESIYAGADHEKLGLDLGQNIGGTITEIHGTLKITDNHFTIINKEAVAANMNWGWYDLIWMINVAKGTPAGFYPCEVTLSYKLDGVDSSETPPMYFNLTVQWTPYVAFPDNAGYTDPLVTLVQNSAKANFTVPLKNDGNVKLDNVKLRLDLDRAQWFMNGEFYYNENDWADEEQLDISYEVETIDVGQTVNAVFPSAVLKNNLPPGRYLIPVDYTANYYDTGVVGSSDLRTAGYYDEYGYYDHTNILNAISYPEPTGNYFPGIFVEVVDDTKGIQVSGEINGIYSPNQRNAYMYMYVYNWEHYTFSSLTYYIHTDGGSPIKRLSVPDDDLSTTLNPIRRSYLWDGSSDGFSFYVDIKQLAKPGTNFIKVDVEAYNPHGTLVKFSFDVSVNIAPNTPQFELLSFTAAIGSGQTATVTAVMENVGWGSARNMSMYFRSNSASIVMVDSPAFIGQVVQGQVFNYTFTVKPSNDQQVVTGSWAGYIHYEYVDDGGGIRKLFTAGSVYINFIINPKMPSLYVTNVQAPGVNPGDKFTVTLTIANIGGSTSYGTKAMWVVSQALFGVQGQSEFVLGDLAPGQSANITLNIKASKACLPTTTYYLYMYVSYSRIDGYGYTYYEGGSKSFTVHTVPESLPPAKTEQVVEQKQSGWSFDIGYFMIGLFVFLAVVVGVYLYKKPTVPAYGAEPEVRAARPLPPPPPPDMVAKK